MPLYQVSIPRATFGIVTNEKEVVVESAPIGRWMIGKHIASVAKWIKKQPGGKLVAIEEKVDG